MKTENVPDNREFRIMELDEYFYVQGKFEDIKGIWFWARKVHVWNDLKYNDVKMMFNTLEGAQEKIKKLKNGVTYYYD